jgi:hypothetical protein
MMSVVWHFLFLILSLVLLGLPVCTSMANNPYQKSKVQKFAVSPKIAPNLVPAAFQFPLRLGSGAFVSGYKVSIGADGGEKTYSTVKALGYELKETSKVSDYARPKIPLELYEFEGCPFCRKVREAIIILDLDPIVYPCPKGEWRS